MSEFLEASAELQRISQLVEKLKDDAKKSLLSSFDRQILIVLLSHVSKLAGSTPSYMRLFSWNLDNGLLAKLKNYCAFFSQNAVHQEKKILLLQQYANKMWLTCISTLDLIQATLKPSSTPETFDWEELYKSLDKVIHCMQRFSNLIKKIIFQFRDDENVIFFLLRHQREFNTLFGSQFIAKLFLKMFPKGLAESERFLSKRYSLRGFDNLIPIISLKISQLCTASKKP